MPLRKKKKIFECDQRPVVAGSYALHQFMEDEDKKSPEWKPNDIDVSFPNRYDPGKLATAYAKHILNLSNGEVKLYVTSRATEMYHCAILEDWLVLVLLLQNVFYT